jgi:Carboxypeptidase regulatory-like domain
MRRAARISLSLATLVLGFCTRLGIRTFAAADENSGVLEGTVRYENGNPANGATVYASPMDRPMVAIIPHAATDETGHFAIPHLQLGKYAVAAEKLDEDYPEMSEQFYSDGKLETVFLSARHAAADVELRLGPKAGVLMGTVADAVAGSPLSPCVELIRASEPNNFLRSSGVSKPNYRLLIPPNAGVLVKMWLGGYTPWYFPGTVDKSKSTPVHLKPGEVVTLDIRLQPGKNAEGYCPAPFSSPSKP